jgi:hypothetical protein
MIITGSVPGASERIRTETQQYPSAEFWYLGDAIGLEPRVAG